MAYTLSAFIARIGAFASYQALSPCITVVPMAQGFEMLLNDTFLQGAIEKGHRESQSEFAHVPRNVDDECPYFLTDAVASVGFLLSIQQPIAYVEAEYFGGVGEQYAVLWNKGQITLLPLTNGFSSHQYKERGLVFLKDAPINSILRVLGVQVETIDEFASVGLMLERGVTDWFRRFNPHANTDACKSER